MSSEFDVLLLVSSQWSGMSDPKPYFNKLCRIMYDCFFLRKLFFFAWLSKFTIYLRSHQCIGGALFLELAIATRLTPVYPPLLLLNHGAVHEIFKKLPVHPLSYSGRVTPQNSYSYCGNLSSVFYFKMAKVCAHFVL